MWHRTSLKLAALCAALFTATAAEAQRTREDWRPENRTEWESLGAAEIGTRLERDVIKIGRREGRFSSVGFTVSGGDVRIEDLTIVYGNGDPDKLQVREVFRDGTRSRPIDLEGGERFIQQIEVTYRSAGAVRIEFFGEKQREGWQELGCHEVRFLEPNDVIRVGRREGAFRALKLQVSNATLRLNRMRVVFSDGSSQMIDVRSAIPAGAETRPIDLDGRRRAIERIELDYIPSLSLRRSARVCVLAYESGRRGPGDRPWDRPGGGRWDDRGGRWDNRGDRR